MLQASPQRATDPLDGIRTLAVATLLTYAQSVAAYGYVGGVGMAPYNAPRGNLAGDPYFTDGLRIVVFVSKEPVDISEIEFMNFGLQPARVGSQ